MVAKGVNLRSYELTEELCNCPGRYCLMKTIVAALNPRIIEQVDCVEIFKYELGEKFNREISANEAWKIWADRGYALIFDNVYTEEKSPRQLYSEVLAQNGGLSEIVDKNTLVRG